QSDGGLAPWSRCGQVGGVCFAVDMHLFLRDVQSPHLAVERIPPERAILRLFRKIGHSVAGMSAANSNRFIKNAGRQATRGGETFPKMGVLLQAELGVESSDLCEKRLPNGNRIRRKLASGGRVLTEK